MKTDYEISRRQFAKLAGLFSMFPVVNASFGKVFENNFFDNTHGLIINEEEGERYILRKGSIVTIKISKEKDGIDSFSFCSSDIIAGDQIHLHKHLKEDELFYIRSGEGIFTMDEESFQIKAGSIVFIPRDTWHGLKNTGQDILKTNFLFFPSGTEGFFREVGQSEGSKPKQFTEEEFLTITKKYNIVHKDLSSRLKQQ